MWHYKTHWDSSNGRVLIIKTHDGSFSWSLNELQLVISPNSTGSSVIKRSTLSPSPFLALTAARVPIRNESSWTEWHDFQPHHDGIDVKYVTESYYYARVAPRDPCPGADQVLTTKVREVFVPFGPTRSSAWLTEICAGRLLLTCTDQWQLLWVPELNPKHYTDEDPN